MKSNSRGKFLKTSLALPPALVALSSTATGTQAPGDGKSENSSASLPRRKLGRNGPEIPILTLGGSFNAHSVAYYEQSGKIPGESWRAKLTGRVDNTMSSVVTSASHGCRYGVDYADVLQRARRYFC